MEATVLPSDLPTDAPARPRRLPAAEAPRPALDAAVDWVRDHQFPAMIGAFALGVFLGVLARR